MTYREAMENLNEYSISKVSQTPYVTRREWTPRIHRMYEDEFSEEISIMRSYGHKVVIFGLTDEEDRMIKKYGFIMPKQKAMMSKHETYYDKEQDIMKLNNLPSFHDFQR